MNNIDLKIIIRYIMKPKKNIFLLSLLCLTGFGYSQIDTVELEQGVDYDARFFLTMTQKQSFNKIFPDFDSVSVEKDWEWKDVDPIALFSPNENRAIRRAIFLFEHNPFSINENNYSLEQVAYKVLIENQIHGCKILIDKNNAKIWFPYTSNYEDFSPRGYYSLLEKISDLGLQWAQAGGDNLYLYNGEILLGKFKSGYVSVAKLLIDKPNVKYIEKVQ